MFTSTDDAVDPTRQFFRRRRDIQGIRALAVLLVLAYHAEIPRFSGGYIGVDIFFVISGFLITNLLVREFDLNGKISLTDFYARRVRRLLPASLVAVVSTLVMSRIWLEPLRLGDLTQDARAAALFITNLLFASRESDYLQSALPPSPLQHYWSLGVEEQFYIFFPLIVMLLLKIQRNSKMMLKIGLALITAISLVLCVALTSKMPSATFYLLPFRAWELGAGALLTLVYTQVQRTNSVLRESLGWLAVISVLVTGFLYDSRTLFPGYAAVLPVVATLMMIASDDNSRFGPSRVFEIRILQWVGSRSYSLYLWHWPILIVAKAANKTDLSAIQVALCLVATFIFAELSFQFVEQPIHRVPNFIRSTQRTLTFGVVLIVIGLVASLITAPTSAREIKTIENQSSESTNSVTATTVFQYSDDQLKEFLNRASDIASLPPDLEPTLVELDADEPEIYKIGCHDHDLDEPPQCIFGNPNSATSIALFGDSHAAQWFEPLRRIAEQRGFKFQTFTRSGCTPLGLETGVIENCKVWQQNALQLINDKKFSLVIISGFTNPEDLADESPDGLLNNLSDLHAAITANGQNVLYLADTPVPQLHVPICLSGNANSVQNCTFLREVAFNPQTYEVLKGVWSSETSRFVDLTDWFCTTQICPVVIGNMVVYRDISHISSAYALALTNVLQREIDFSLKN